MSHVATEAPTAPISSFVSDLDHLVADVMADWKVPGVALAVVQDGKVALTRAYGQRDVEADLPVTTVDEVILHQPNGTFVAQRVEE
jgi:CubicO group peptidase (beta-lactamase class C family)